MRQLALLAALYLLVAALVLPASPFAADDVKAPEGQTPEGPTAQPPSPQPAPAQPEQPEQPPASSTEPARAPPPQTPVPAAAPAPQAQPATSARKGRRPKAHAATPGSVTIKDFSYGPAAVTVTAGDSVTWTNNGPTRHSATASNGSFDTGLLAKGKSASHTFTQAGDVSYVCSLHAFMHGTVHVIAASSGGGPATGSGNSGSSASGSSNGSTPAPSSGSTASSGTSSGSALPRTGSDTGALALLGVLMLGFGVAMRRRSASA